MVRKREERAWKRGWKKGCVCAGPARAQRAGQISVEYLLILGMALLILIPGSYLFYKYSRSTNDQVVRGQIDAAGSQIIGQARDVYSFGNNNRVTIDVEIPAAVKNITIYDGIELDFTYDSSSGVQEALFFSLANITGSYQQDGTPCPAGWCAISRWSDKGIMSGLISLQIESQGDYVTINQTN